MAYIKLKVKSMDRLMAERHAYNVGLDLDMLELANSTVSIDTDQSFFTDPDEDLEYDGFYINDESGYLDHSYIWEPGMFVDFPAHLMPTYMQLEYHEEIDGNTRVRLHVNGAITVGCQTVEFSVL